jgi:predicted regulator of Ras-like GTPase activity (Roadblock/LC7/MglB family)/GTPase SAR1 family protein
LFTLIQYINILTREGKSLLFRNYGSSDVDKDLLAGFLNNFSDFMKEGSQSDIKSTATDEFKYYYTINDNFSIVVCTDLEDDEATINSKIISIRVKFTEKFGELLSNGQWTENRSIFTGFEREIDDIILGAIKISIIGMGGTGKTDLLRLICGKDIDLEYIPTINVEITPFNGQELDVPRSIEFWNFAGQSNFRSLWKSLLDSIDIALLVLDSSFENVNYSKDIIRDILDKHYRDVLVIGIANKQDMPNRLTPQFCERILSEAGREPPIRVHGMVATNPVYREKMLAILRDAINEIPNGFKPSYEKKLQTQFNAKVRQEFEQLEDEELSFDTKRFKNILSKIIKSESGVKKVILVDRTGLTVASVSKFSKFSYFPVDIDGIGAIASAVFCASEEQGKNLDLGELEIVTSEFSGGKIFTSSCGPKGILTLITDPDINIGLIRLILKRSGDGFLSDKPDWFDRGGPGDPGSASEAALVDF